MVTSPLKKMLFVAYDLNPKLGSEAGAAYLWLKVVSKYFHTLVITDEVHKQDIAPEEYANVEIHFVRVPRIIRLFTQALGAKVDYQLFLNRVRKTIVKILAENEIALIHCITPNGIHSYNDLYRWQIPILIGPITGGLSTPKHFSRIFRDQWLKNISRDFYYRWFMRTPGWRAYFINAWKIIAGTEDVKRLLPEPARDKCEIIFDVVVDVDYFTPPSADVNSDREPVVKKILFSGSLLGKKGIQLLLEAARECLARGVGNFAVEVAGSGPLLKRARAFMDAYGLKRHVRFLGKLSRPELLLKYRESDIFCLPTLREPGGNVILEAMACGLPVITTNYGGPAYSVVEDCGIKIDLSDYSQYVKDLADALIYLIQNDDVRLAMGKAARRRVEKEFSLQALEGRLLNILKEVLG